MACVISNVYSVCLGAMLIRLFKYRKAYDEMNYSSKILVNNLSIFHVYNSIYYIIYQGIIIRLFR